MELLTQLFSAKHLEIQANIIHAKYVPQYEKQGEDHREWRATFYTRAKRFPAPLMPSHTFDQWKELCKDEHPNCKMVTWLEDELKYWLDQTDNFRKSINVWAHIPWQEHGFMLRVALIAEKKRLDKARENLE